MCCCCAQGTPAHLPAEVLVKRRKRVRGGSETWEIVRARGHLDEVQELRSAAPQSAHPCLPELSPQLLQIGLGSQELSLQRPGIHSLLSLRCR